MFEIRQEADVAGYPLADPAGLEPESVMADDVHECAQLASKVQCANVSNLI